MRLKKWVGKLTDANRNERLVMFNDKVLGDRARVKAARRASAEQTTETNLYR